MSKKFIENIQNFRRKVDARSKQVFQESCEKASYEIADKTPVSKGTLLGQWSPNVDAATSYTFQGGESAWKKEGKKWYKDESIASANRSRAMRDLEPRIKSATSALSTKNVYYFTNDTEYARKAEYEGWNETGAYFMVLKTSQNFSNIVNRIIARYKDA